MHCSLLFQLEALHIPVGILYRFHNLLRMKQKGLALIGKGNMLLPPIYQGQLQLRFQGLDSLGNGGLGNMQLFCRAGKIFQAAQSTKIL